MPCRISFPYILSKRRRPPRTLNLRRWDLLQFFDGPDNTSHKHMRHLAPTTGRTGIILGQTLEVPQPDSAG